EKRPVYENDIEHSAHLSGLRRLAIRHGAKSVIALPLQPEDEIFGFLVLYAPERNFFDDEELRLLRELASDISLALELISKGEKLHNAEAALRDAANPMKDACSTAREKR
ncbi:MAG: GAF domain-containing protein, partial [Woeseiaceae bacterium]